MTALRSECPPVVRTAGLPTTYLHILYLYLLPPKHDMFKGSRSGLWQPPMAHRTLMHMVANILPLPLIIGPFTGFRSGLWQPPTARKPLNPQVCAMNSLPPVALQARLMNSSFRHPASEDNYRMKHPGARTPSSLPLRLRPLRRCPLPLCLLPLCRSRRPAPDQTARTSGACPQGMKG
jgi:hypothetical protein